MNGALTVDGAGLNNVDQGIVSATEKVTRYLSDLKNKLSSFALNKEKQPENVATSEIKDESEKIGKEMTLDEAREINSGFASLGFEINRLKNAKFAEGFEHAASHIGKEKSTGRFFDAMSKIFERDKDAAEKSLIELAKDRKEGKEAFLSLRKMTGTGALIGNLTMYGRLAFDVFGGGLAARAATRFGMGVAMAGATLAEAGKEARFMNEENENTSRIQDVDAAFDEAMKIYETARQNSSKFDKNGNPDKDSLSKAYQETIPMDILRRLAQKEGGVTNVIDKVFKWRIESVANKLQNQLNDINLSNLPKEEKEKKKSEVLYGFLRSPMLRDFDRAVGQSGMVDRSFMLLRTLEQTGKLATYGMIGDTLIRTLWSSIPNLITSAEAAQAVEVSSFTSEEPALDKNIGNSVASLNENVGVAAVSPLFTSYEVKTGDNLTTIIYNQLRDAGMLKGTSKEDNLKIIETFKHKFEAADLKALGISSGSIDLIKPGEKIDLSLLNDKTVIENIASSVTGQTAQIAADLSKFENMTAEELAAGDGFQNPVGQIISSETPPAIIISQAKEDVEYPKADAFGVDTEPSKVDNISSVLTAQQEQPQVIDSAAIITKVETIEDNKPIPIIIADESLTTEQPKVEEDLLKADTVKSDVGNASQQSAEIKTESATPPTLEKKEITIEQSPAPVADASPVEVITDATNTAESITQNPAAIETDSIPTSEAKIETGPALNEQQLKLAHQMYDGIVKETTAGSGFFGFLNKGGENTASWQSLVKEDTKNFLQKFARDAKGIHMYDNPTGSPYSSEQGKKLAKSLFDFADKGIKPNEGEKVGDFLNRAIAETVQNIATQPTVSTEVPQSAAPVVNEGVVTSPTETRSAVNVENVPDAQPATEEQKTQTTPLSSSSSQAVSQVDKDQVGIDNQQSKAETVVEKSKIDPALVIGEQEKLPQTNEPVTQNIQTGEVVQKEPQPEIKEQEKAETVKPADTVKENRSTEINQSGMEKLRVNEDLAKGVKPEDIQTPPVSSVPESQPQVSTTPISGVDQPTVIESVVPQQPQPASTTPSPQSVEQVTNGLSNKDLKTLPLDKLPALTKEQDDMAFKFLGDTLQIIDKKGLLSTTRAVDTPLWNAVYDKPVDLMLGYMDKDARGRMVNLGFVDKEYLTRDSESYVRDVLKLNDSEIRMDTRLYNFNEKIKEFIKQGIRPFPEEKMQDYLRRVSRVMILKK